MPASGERCCLHPLVEQELVEAANFYETRAAGLGSDFLREVERMLAQIVAHPEAGSVATATIRRRLIRRLPFAILYQANSAGISVLALMHLRRRPGYWKDRLQGDTTTDP